MGNRRFLIRVRGTNIDIARVPPRSALTKIAPVFSDYKVVAAPNATQAITKHLRNLGQLGPNEFLGKQRKHK